MTVTPTLPAADDRHGWHALAVRWPNLPEHVTEDLRAQMNRGMWRRFERTLAEIHEDKRTFGKQYATREDVVRIQALFIEQKWMPMAARLDEAEAMITYLLLPLHKRLWVQATKVWIRFTDWLATKGIRLVKMEETDEHTEDHTDLDARGEEAGADAGGGEEDGGPPDGDRLQPRDDGGVGAGGGRPGAIEVVSR